MALKEGRCKNCGSILFLNAGQEKSHCLYCDAVFDTQEALEIARNPEGYEFPNLPQEKYEGPSLEPQAMQSLDFEALTKSAAVANQANKVQHQATETPAYVPKVDKVPDLNLPLKWKLGALAAVFFLAAAFAAIMVPQSLTRLEQRRAIVDAFNEKHAYELELGRNIDLQRQDNSMVLLSLETLPEEAEARKLYEELCAVRRDIRAKAGAQPYEMDLYLSSEAGGYRMDGQGDAYSLTKVD